MSNSTPSPTPLADSSSQPAVPILHELRLSKDAEDWLKTISPSTFANYDAIQRVWNAPSTQFTITLLQDTEFKGAVDRMRMEHAGGRFLGYEAVMILVFWILRAWRLQKASTWLLRMWTQAWIAVLFWLAALFLVPYLAWGQSYWTAMKELLKATFRHYFA